MKGAKKELEFTMVTSGAVVAAFVVMVMSNVMASKKLFGGKDNKELSDENPTYLSPDGATFAIWGMIYLLELLVVAQLFHGELMERRCPLTALSEIAWSPPSSPPVAAVVFNHEQFWSAMVIIFYLLEPLSQHLLGREHGHHPWP